MLEEFIRQSREWATITRGRVLFDRAASVFQHTYGVDSGMVVYKKRFLNEKNQFRVYSPWGLGNETEKSLSSLISTKEFYRNWDSIEKETWMNAEEVHTPWKELWIKNKITKVGIWPIMSGSEPLGGILLGHRNGDFSEEMHLFSLCALQISLILDMLTMRRIAEHASTHDPLTQILNRRGYEEFKLKLARSHENIENMVIGVLDVDNFKLHNDEQGHKIGDSVLVDIASTLKERVGKNGCCVRLGGDEFFVAIKNGVDYQNAETIIESWFYDKPYSVSVGCARLEDGNWEKTFKIADERLYFNKRLKNLSVKN